MLTWIAIGAALGALAVVGNWWRHHDDSRRTPARPPWVGAGILVAVAAVAGTFVLRHRALESRLSRVASDLAGRPVKVRCETYTATFVDPNVEAGYVMFDASGRPAAVTAVKPDVCRDLAAYLRSAKTAPSRAQVIAVHVVTHESMHLGGEGGEAQAECAAVQRDARTARLLGAPPAAAARLASAYWATVFPSMPDAYRAGECRPGGALDEHLGDGPWAAA